MHEFRNQTHACFMRTHACQHRLSREETPLLLHPCPLRSLGHVFLPPLWSTPLAGSMGVCRGMEGEREEGREEGKEEGREGALTVYFMEAGYII